jgi:cation:H+ antiporter
VDKIFEFLAPLLSAVATLITTPNYDRIFSAVTSTLSAPNPWQLLALFLISSMVMIWRLNAIESKGFEGTVIGTLVMPYCSGFANISFAYVMATQGGAAELLLENCFVNNFTTHTVWQVIPAIFWGVCL